MTTCKFQILQSRWFRSSLALAVIVIRTTTGLHLQAPRARKPRGFNGRTIIAHPLPAAFASPGEFSKRFHYPVICIRRFFRRFFNAVSCIRRFFSAVIAEGSTATPLASVDIDARGAQRSVTARAADEDVAVVLRADIACPYFPTRTRDTTPSAFSADLATP